MAKPKTTKAGKPWDDTKIGQGKAGPGTYGELSDERIVRMRDEVLKGGSIETVVGAICGVRGRGYKKWRRRGKRDLREGVDTLYARFVHGVLHARDTARYEVQQDLKTSDPKYFDARYYPAESTSEAIGLDGGGRVTIHLAMPDNDRREG